jgi:hypothetical protein
MTHRGGRQKNFHLEASKSNRGSGVFNAGLWIEVKGVIYYIHFVMSKSWALG